MASAPPDAKKVTSSSPGAISASLAASLMAGAVLKPPYAELNASSFICSAATSASTDRPWPTFTFQSEARPSMYSRPAESVMVAPLPLAMISRGMVPWGAARSPCGCKKCVLSSSRSRLASSAEIFGGVTSTG